MKNENKQPQNSKKDKTYRPPAGTLGYIAPELYQQEESQAKDKNDKTNTDNKPFLDLYKAEIWSCGVVLYTMLHGRLPFSFNKVHINSLDKENKEKSAYSTMKNKELKQLLIDMTNENYSIDGGFSKECVSLLQRLLKKEPLQRPTLEEILKDPWLYKVENQLSHTIFNQQEIQYIQKNYIYSDKDHYKRESQETLVDRLEK